MRACKLAARCCCTWHTIVFGWLLLLPCATNGFSATPWEQNRLTPLSKITVGPWDNFETSINKDDTVVYYTRDRIQIPRIYRQDLKSNRADVFIGQNGDAKDPALGPGSRLAFTYFRHDAQGDVCVTTLPEKKIRCLTDAKTVDASPFWIDEKRLGFLSRATAEQRRQLNIVDLDSGTITTLTEGAISAPVAGPDGRYILYNQSDQDGLRIRVYDMKNGDITIPVPFDLSGITGFMSFSRDGQYLYFNHYLNDTNLDQVIDGNDHSVAFRVPFQKWLTAKKPFFPEQLTSVANNCKFPTPSDQYLYLTCAFEGSLDIYRLPLTGAVPPKWNQAQLWEAHLSAREYEDRLLVLNTLRYRFNTGGIAMLERLLSNHLQLNELTAASYYLNQIKQHYQNLNRQSPAVFYELLQQYLNVRSSKQRVPVGMITAKFQNLVSQKRRAFQNSEGWPALITLMEAYLDYELEQRDAALAKLKTLPLSEDMLPMQRYIHFDLYENLLSKEPEKLLPHYEPMMNAANLSQEAKLYYGFNYLKTLQTVQTNTGERIQTIESHIKGLADPGVTELFRSEILSIKLAAGSRKADDPVQRKHFAALTAKLNENRGNPLLRKTMHTRSIQILGDAEQFRFMELLSRNWLLTTKVSEMEFVSVAEQYAVITMDKAYGMLADADPANAYGTFFSAIQQTNDLEAHYQFITMGRNEELNSRIDQQRAYETLKKRNILGQNESYANALRLVLQARTAEKTNLKDLDKALSLLNAMQVRGLNPAMRDLLIGYIYHLKMRASRDHYRYDKRYFQNAHHHYMLALDLGKENRRISAAVWENLGWLHFEARNYGLAADFFQQRMSMPFTGATSEIRVRWSFARALFYNNLYDEAAQQAQSVLQTARDYHLEEQPYLEKAAFYSLQAKQYRQAAQRYQRFLQGETKPVNRAKAMLGYGFALMKSADVEAARRQFNDVLKLTGKLTAGPSRADRLVAFQPARLRWLALGLLAALADNPEEQAVYRQRRVNAWRSIKGKTGDYANDESGRLSAVVKDLNLKAAALENAGDRQAMADAMNTALREAGAWSALRSDPAGPVMYRTLINYLSLGITHEDHFADERNNQILGKAVAAALKEFTQSAFSSPVGNYQHAKLALLWEIYRSRVMDKKDASPEQGIKSILERDAVKQIQREREDLFNELQTMAHNLLTME